MSARTAFRSTLKWAFAPVLVVIYLNIENRASDAGLSRVSFTQAIEWLGMSGLYRDLTSNTALYIALFLAGGCTFAWISYLLERADIKWDSWAINTLSADCEFLAGMLEGKNFFVRWVNVPRVIERLNAKLARFAFEPLPTDFRREDKERNLRTARYLRGIAPLMKINLELAREVGESILSREKAKAVTRRSPLGTGAGTQP